MGLLSSINLLWSENIWGGLFRQAADTTSKRQFEPSRRLPSWETEREVVHVQVSLEHQARTLVHQPREVSGVGFGLPDLVSTSRE